MNLYLSARKSESEREREEWKTHSTEYFSDDGDEMMMIDDVQSNAYRKFSECEDRARTHACVCTCVICVTVFEACH